MSLQFPSFIDPAGGLAPVNAAYVTISDDPTLTSDRFLAGTINQILLSDGGANAAMTLSLPQDIAATSSPTFAALNITNRLFINETVNTFMTAGITIQQGPADDEGFALKSSDVAHGITSNAEADTYFTIRKEQPTSGGALLRGYGEGAMAIVLQGVADSGITTKLVTSDAPAHVSAGKRAGSSFVGVAANENIFIIQNQNINRFIFAEDAAGNGGTLHYIPDGDNDLDFIIAQVTGTPTFGWNQTDQLFTFDKGLTIPSLGIGTSTPNSTLELAGLSPGSVGGFPAGQLEVRSTGTLANDNAVITGHNSFSTNTQLWYLGSSSSSNQDVTFLNRQNASLSLGTNSIERLTISNAGVFSTPGDLDLITGTGGVFKFNSDAILAGLDGSNQLELGHGGSNAFLNNTGAGGIDFRFVGSTLATFTPNGHLHLMSTVDLKHNLKLITNNNANDTGIAWENSGGNFSQTIFRTDVGSNRSDLIFAIGSNADIDLLTSALAIRGSAVDEGVVEVLTTLGIGGTPVASARLQVDSTTQGFLPPRMTTTQRNAIGSPATGLMVYDNTLNQWFGHNGTDWVILG